MITIIGVPDVKVLRVDLEQYEHDVSGIVLVEWPSSVLPFVTWEVTKLGDGYDPSRGRYFPDLPSALLDYNERR